jgi:hypothetical protein
MVWRNPKERMLPCGEKKNQVKNKVERENHPCGWNSYS